MAVTVQMRAASFAASSFREPLAFFLVTTGRRTPGLPGKVVALVVRLPAGVQMAARQLRIGWLRRLPLLYGQMARRPVPGELVRHWTEPVLSDPDLRRDLLAYCRGTFDKAALIRDTEALRRFRGDALVL